MENESHEDDVLRIEVLVPEQESAGHDPSRRVQVWFVGDPSAPVLALTGHVTGSSSSPEMQDDGQLASRLQIEVSLEEVLSLWNSIGDVHAGDAPQAVSSCGKSHYSVGRLIGPPEDAEAAAENADGS